MPNKTSVALLAAVVAIVTILSNESRAYKAGSARWMQNPVPYYVNATNLDGLPATMVVSAVRAGADAWMQQSTAAFAFLYAGPSGQTTNTNDATNLVLFRNATSGQAIATTYSWFSGSSLIDTDIVFWDGSFQFFAGTSGCSAGFYIEDIATHEFGHALGLDHSALTSATMYPSVSYCSTANRTLDPDDQAGVLAIYGPRQLTIPAPTGLRFIR
jgi:hypothetical protein